MTSETRHDMARATRLRYSTAILSVLLATLARMALNPLIGTSFPFATFFLAVMFTAWYGGLGPSLLALALGLPAATYFLFPANSWLISLNQENLLGLALYLVVGLGLTLLGEAMHRATSRAEQNAQAIARSKELLSATLNSIGDAVIATDNQGRVTFLNPVAASLTGWPPREAVGQPLDQVFSIINEATRATVESPVVKVLREGVVVGLANHALLIAKDGRPIPIADSGAPIKDQDGALIGVILVFRDVTERQRHEQALRASEERFSKAFSASPLAMSISRFEDRRFIDVNDAFLRVTGYSREEVFGRSGLEVGIWPTPEERAQVPRIDGEQDPLRNVECRLRLKSGQIHTFALSAEAVEIGGERCVLSVIDDITKRKQVEAEVRRLHEELEQRVANRTAKLQAANQELEAFSYTVSHDLRAPLRAIDGFSRILLEDYADKLDAEGRRVLNVIRSNTVRMGKLIDDLLEFSRLGRRAMDDTRVALSELAKAAFAELCAANPERTLELQAPDLLMVRGDRAMLRQMMVNLLANAVKFTRLREVGKIELGSRVDNGETVYFVRDNGTGFDMQYVNKLFGVFQRLHSDKEYEGTGVGLAIVQRIIHRHGGRVWAEGAINEGAIFSFTLPGFKQMEPEG